MTSFAETFLLVWAGSATFIAVMYRAQYQHAMAVGTWLIRNPAEYDRIRSALQAEDAL